MEIIYLTDIHDDLKQLRYVVQSTSADLYIISGDLIYKAFYTEDKLYHFLEVQEYLYAHIKREKLNLNPYELAKKVLQTPEKYSLKLKLESAEYRLLFQQAALNMKEKYQVIADLIKKYASANVIMIPGNYDMDLQYTALHYVDLHKRSVEVNGVRFTGYGGAPIVTPGIPEMLSVAFHEYESSGRLESEPREFMKSHEADVLVIHNPAYGTLDKLPSHGHCGSLGIREYIDNFNPSLVLSGHVHEDYGLLKTGKSYCLNPSNFGGVETPAGYEPGGYFSSVVLEKDEKVFVRQVTEYRLLENTIKKISEVKIDRNLRARELVYEDNEFNQMGRFLR